MKYMNQVESYARGLAIADGSKLPYGNSLRYTMAIDALPALEKISSFWSKNGVRYQGRVKGRPQTKALVSLTLSDKGQWKSSLEGIENDRHAVRGYFEGDGCWCPKFLLWSGGKRVARHQINYSRAVFYVSYKEMFILEWIKNFLTNNRIHFTCCGIKTRTGNISYQVMVQSKNAIRLMELLYLGSTIQYKKIEVV